MTLASQAPTAGRPMAAPAPDRFTRTWWAGWLPRPTVLCAGLLGGVVVATPFLARPIGLLLAAAVVVVALVRVLWTSSS